MLVELHTHTHHSVRELVPVEGLNSPQEMVAYAKKIGLGAIAITDHDQFKGALEAKRFEKKYDIIIIPGEEVTTRSGHLLAIDIQEFIRPGMVVEETIDEIHSQGGIAIASHPFDIKNEGIGQLAAKADAIEVFNAINMERITNNRAKKFATLHKKPQVAGGDAHCAEMLGYGVNEIDASGTDDILKAIRKGKVDIRGKYIPARILMYWSVTRLKLSYPHTLAYINKNYSLPKRIISRHMLGLVKRSPGNIDYLLKGLTYFGLGSAVIYSVVKNTIRQ